MSKGLDEMQVQRKNKIGNQAFLILMYLLLLDAGLYGFGFRWISYPANIMIILTICSGIYVVRLITGSAFVGPTTDKRKPLLRVFLTVLFSVLVASTIIVLLKVASFSNNSQIDDMSAPILFNAAAIALIIAVITGVIKNIQNKDDSE